MEESIKGQEDFIASMKQYFAIEQVDGSQYSPLTLAYIGDSVYELVIRTVLVSRGDTQVNKLNKRASKMAKASTQAALAQLILPDLTQEEESALRRGRNAKSNTMAKNATMADYRHATGLEALIGYLYLEGRYERLMGLLNQGISRLKEDGLGEI